STAEDWNRYLTDYYFKLLHHLPIDEITTEQIQTQVDIIASQSGNRTAEVCCTVMRVLFKWADKTGKLPEGHRNPMDNVQPPARSPSRARVLTDDEIRLILQTCEDLEALAIQEHQFKETMSKGPRKGHLFHPDYPRAVKLLFFTGCRRQEIGGLEWSEVDLDNAELFIPGTRAKNKRDLCNPLCDMAVEILRNIARQPNDPTYVFRRSRARKKLPGLNLNNVHLRVDDRITKAGGTPPPDWTIHDIRRTFRTRMAALGVTGDVAEALVGHVGHRTEMDRTYNLHKYWAEKKLALAKYEDHLRAIIEGTAKKIESPNFGQRKGGTA